MKRDESEIRKYMTVIKGSLSEKYPQLIPEWDFEANGEITPDKVKPGSRIKVFWICPECGKHYESSVGHRTAKKPTGCPDCGIRKNALARSRAIEMIDIDTNEVIKVYQSISEAARENSISQGNIGMVCKGVRKSAGGYSWRYLD